MERPALSEEEALASLREHHPRTSYVLPNHPERSSRYRNAPDQTDDRGHPLADTVAAEAGIVGPKAAWSDLWFYTNPIFIRIN